MMPAFGQDGLPEAVVEFDYPEDDRPAEASKLEYRQQGFIAALHLCDQARTLHAVGLRVAAAQYVFSRSNDAIAKAAKRWGVSVKHFSKVVNQMRKAAGISEFRHGRAGVSKGSIN